MLLQKTKSVNLYNLYRPITYCDSKFEHIKHSVASTNPEQAVIKPLTRKELVGQLLSTLSDTKLPAKKKVLHHCFFFITNS